MTTILLSSRHRLIIAATLFCGLSALPSLAWADNPIVQTNYTSDPAPFVSNGTMYLVTTHDENVAGQPCTAVAGYTLCKWYTFSSTDMVNWTDHGVVATWSTFSWASTAAWAPQAIPRNGKFYIYVPLSNKSGATVIGVGVATSPIGPYQDAIGQPLVTSGCSGGTGDIDPTVFIDDDGQAYLYFGRSVPGYVKLNSDMISYSGGIQCPTVNTQSFGPAPSAGGFPSQYEEGPWIMKHGGTYFLGYAANNIPEDIAYSKATAPGGPFTYVGTIMKASGASFTNHTGIIDFNGHSYFFYHNGALKSGGSVPSNGDGYHRSVCLEEFTYNADGSFPTIAQTTGGPKAIANLNPYVQTEAETIAFESGVQTEVTSDTGGGMDVTSIQNGDYIKVKNVNFGSGATSFDARVASDASGGSIELHLDSQTGTLIGTCTVSGTGGAQTWTTKTCSVSGATGLHDLFLKFTGTGTGNLFNFNWWQFSGPGAADQQDGGAPPAVDASSASGTGGSGFGGGSGAGGATVGSEKAGSSREKSSLRSVRVPRNRLGPISRPVRGRSGADDHQDVYQLLPTDAHHLPAHHERVGLHRDGLDAVQLRRGNRAWFRETRATGSRARRTRQDITTGTAPSSSLPMAPITCSPTDGPAPPGSGPGRAPIPSTPWAARARSAPTPTRGMPITTGASVVTHTTATTARLSRSWTARTA
jgi:arabinoxylan arabinofuranohydrolase